MTTDIAHVYTAGSDLGQRSWTNHLQSLPIRRVNPLHGEDVVDRNRFYSRLLSDDNFCYADYHDRSVIRLSVRPTVNLTPCYTIATERNEMPFGLDTHETLMY